MDLIWPSSNEFQVPDLLPDRQPVALDAPLDAYGSHTRRGSFSGTYHFYVDDYRFAAIWQKPDIIVDHGALAAVEPNFSVFDQTPYPVALWATYRKRWLARYWQEAGLNIWVDLNVSETHSEVNLLGVPSGWSRFATRGYDERLPDLEREYGIAARHAARDPVFLVYGGGTKTRDACKTLPGCIHVADTTAPRRWRKAQAVVVAEEALVELADGLQSPR